MKKHNSIKYIPENKMQASGLTKEEFLETNAIELDQMAREQDLSLEIVWPIMYAEMGLTNGRADPGFVHSEGERGVLPLPSNLSRWTGDPKAPQSEDKIPLEDNIRWFMQYLKGITTSSTYKTWFSGVSASFPYMRRLAAIVHGWGYKGVYSGNKFSVKQAREAAEASPNEADRILKKMGYKNAGKKIVPGRLKNLDHAFDMVEDLGLKSPELPASELSTKTRTSPPFNKNRKAEGETPDEKTVKSIQQLVGLAWTDWDEPEMKLPGLEFLNGIKAATAAQKESKAEVQQLVANSWGQSEKLDEFSNLLAAWAKGDIHATGFDSIAVVDGKSAPPSGPAIVNSNLPRANGEQIAICVGHTLSGKGSGYMNKFVSVKNEQIWNNEIANLVRDILEQQGAAAEIYFRTIGSYSKFTADSASQIRQRQPQCKAAIELHYNAYKDPKSNGCEFICFSTSGGRLARALANSFKEHFPEQRMRQDRGILKLSSGRGTGWLKRVPPPAVIAEPFFASNAKEIRFFDKKKVELAEAYAEGLLKFALR